MKLAALLMGLVLAAVAAPARAQDPALRLEMLTERIAKLHVQAGRGVLADRSRKSLTVAVSDFDASLRLIRARHAGPEVRDNYVLLALLWSEYRALALKPPTRDNAKKLAERAEELAWVAAKGERLVMEGRAGSARLAVDAAHAATLSQRLARLYLAQGWGVRQEAAARDIPAISRELQELIGRLRSAPGNTPEVETELHAAEGQLGFLLRNGAELATRGAPPTAPEFVAKSADHILESMERAGRLYEAIAAGSGRP